MILRSIAILALAIGVVAPGPVADAQSPTKVARIGLLDAGSPTVFRRRLWKEFHQQLRELGYVEGKDVVFERRRARGKRDRLPGQARELVALPVDVIVTAATPAAIAASKATSTIPIVMALASRAAIMPAVVKSLARPGGNVTGLITGMVTTKRLELAKEIVPTASRVAVLGDATNQNFAPAVRRLKTAARALGVSLSVHGLRRADDIDRAVSRMADARIHALVIVPGAIVGSVRVRLAKLAAKARIPAVYSDRAYATAGGLVSYGSHVPALFRRAAFFVDRILKGADPATLPIEQERKFELVVNLKTAKALGITIPPSVLLRATDVIE